MSKETVVFICQQCGYKSPSFLGKCPNCQQWNSLVETIERKTPLRAEASFFGSGKPENEAVPVRLDEVRTVKNFRIDTKIGEFNQVIGGGIVPGSLTLIAGDPGIGKSTLTLQLAAKLGAFYVCGEESAEQIKLRAVRLKIPMDKILVLPQTNVEAVIEAVLKNLKSVSAVIIDSIQALFTPELTQSAGSVGQIRECALRLLYLAKQNNLPIILIGHVTKEGAVAGPKVLEHMVDTVLYLEGERFATLRLLRAVKNRFGPVDEIGLFSMEDDGLKEVVNPAGILINDSVFAQDVPAGQAVISVLEGTRPLLVEVQALTVSTNLPLPRRVANGVSQSRLQMITAIIQKHLRLPLANFDLFVNAASGIKVLEPGADLGILLAIVSSFKNIPLPAKTVAIGEIGLLGEIRKVIGFEKRAREAKKLGFTTILSSETSANITTLVGDILRI